MYWSLLQDISYWKEDNPREGMIFLIIIGGLIMTGLLVHLIRRSVNTSVSGKNSPGVAARKFSSFSFHRLASAHGLDKEQTRLLEYIFRNNGVNDPERVMKNPVLLDRHFKRAYKTIERNSDTEEDMQQRLVRLFSLRNAIEAAPNPSGQAAAQPVENTQAVITIGKDTFPVKIISAKGQSVVTDLPRNALGTPVRLAKGARITLSYFNKSNNGFAFDGHIAGTTSTDRGSALQLTSAGKTKALVKRKFRRRESSIHCDFFQVFVQEQGTGRKKTNKLVVDSKRLTGTVLDISIGGCSLKSSMSVQAGARLKLVLDYDDNSLITVLGQVLRTNRSGVSGTIAHIKFLKVPQRAFNSICALVFGYTDE